MTGVASEVGAMRYVSLATHRRSGAEVRTPVWIAAVGARCYVFSAGDSGKVKRLRRDPRVRVARCDLRGAVTGEWIEARARLVDEPALLGRVYAALRAKYGWQMWLTDFFSKLSGRYRRRVVLEIAFDE